MKTLVFDFNGTLFWDSEINYQSWNSCVQNWLKQSYSHEEYRRLNGRSTMETLSAIFNGVDLSDSQKKFYEKEVMATYLHECESHKPLSLAPGLEVFLSAQQEQGKRLAIATSACELYMQKYESWFRLSRFFDKSSIISNNGQYPSKPNPAIYLAVLSKLQVSPDDCVVFEDTSSGIESAYHAGIKQIVAVTGDNVTPLQTTIPVIKIHDFQDLC